MVILHPDLLLSGTRVTGSFRCRRQSVLEERFAGSSNDKAVEGTLMHEVFQVTFCCALHELPMPCLTLDALECLCSCPTPQCVGLSVHALARAHCNKALMWCGYWQAPSVLCAASSNAKYSVGGCVLKLRSSKPRSISSSLHVHVHLTAVQAALTKRITNKARLEEVARCVIARSTDKLFEVGLNEHKVSLPLGLRHLISPQYDCTVCT